MTATIAKQFPKSLASTPISVVTRMAFTASPAEAWNALILYEGAGRPPWHLRLLLPVPVGTKGRISEVGDEAVCFYEGGHFLKRITRIEPGAKYEFVVAEQSLSFGGGMRLVGGGYTLVDLRDGRTEISIETRYRSTKWPRRLWKPIELLVCHSFHRYLLGSIRYRFEST